MHQRTNVVTENMKAPQTYMLHLGGRGNHLGVGVFPKIKMRIQRWSNTLSCLSRKTPSFREGFYAKDMITTLASAAPGVVYRQSLAGPMHGKPGALYFLAAGRLPRGVHITPSGVVQGQPGAASGSYDFSVGMVEQPAGLSGWQLNRAKARSSRYWFRLPVVDGHD